MIDLTRIHTLRDLEEVVVSTAAQRDVLRKRLANAEMVAPDGTVPAAVEMFWALYVSKMGSAEKMGRIIPPDWRTVLDGGKHENG